MALLRHPETGEEREIDGEVPITHQYLVEGYDEDELWEEPRVDLDGDSWIVVDDGVDTFTTG